MKRWMILGIAAVVTAFLLWLALMLGAWGFDYRRFSYHESRLRHMVERKPSLEQVLQGMRDDGSPLIDAPADEAALSRAAERWGRGKAPEVLEKGRSWPTTRVFQAGDVIYFLYFDHAGTLRDFSFVSR